MQGLMYTARFSSTESLAQDLLSLTVLAPNMALLHSVRIGQNSLAGDAAAEMAEIQIARAAVIGSSGSVVTPLPHMNGAPAASPDATCRTSDTTPAASPQIILSDTFNLQAGWLYLPTPEERIQISSDAGAENLVITLPNAVTSAGFAGSMTFELFLG